MRNAIVSFSSPVDFPGKFFTFCVTTCVNTHLEYLRDAPDRGGPLVDEGNLLEDLALGALGHAVLGEVVGGEVDELLVGELEEEGGVLVKSETLQPNVELCG